MTLRHRVVFVFSVIYLFAASNFLNSQEYRSALIAFYNIENLFDTINTPNVRDGEFTPEGSKKWNSEKYWEKINNLGLVISKIGKKEGLSAPAIVGLCEMENRAVLEDLVNDKNIKALNYQIVHFDSPDYRGIDVALLFQPDVFKLLSSRSIPIKTTMNDGTVMQTRDQLVVTGLLDGEKVHFIVNHWPSRYGGEERSKHSRIDAAKVTRLIIDSIMRVEPNAKIIMMGDLNDDPNNESVRLHLNTWYDKNKMKSGQLFNASEITFKQGKGSLYYRGNWNLFDQMILTPALITPDVGGFQYHSFHIFDDPMVLEKEGRFNPHYS